MFRVSLCPSSRGRTAFHCLWFSFLLWLLRYWRAGWQDVWTAVHTSCHPTLQHRNSHNRTENPWQWKAVRPPDDGHKDTRNMLRNNWLQLNHYLLHLVGLAFIYLSKMHGHSNIKFDLKVWGRRQNVTFLTKYWCFTWRVVTRGVEVLGTNFYIAVSEILTHVGVK